MRLWSRRLDQARFGLDDSLMVPAYLVQITLNVASIRTRAFFLACCQTNQPQCLSIMVRVGTGSAS
jgi:hypothetical protein